MSAAAFLLDCQYDSMNILVALLVVIIRRTTRDLQTCHRALHKLTLNLKLKCYKKSYTPINDLSNSKSGTGVNGDCLKDPET